MCVHKYLVQLHRSVQRFTRSACPHGSPVCSPVSNQEVALFRQIGIDIREEATFFEYPKLSVHSSCIVNSRSRSKETKRNNSCILYNRNNFGLIEKIVSVGTGEVYCIVSKLQQSTQQLCMDTTTNAKLNDHLIPFSITDFCCVIPVHSIVAKCVYIDLQETVGNVFVSLFPNFNECE